MEQITYGDGRSVQYSYNALRQLTEIEDWLGITRIELDEAGRAKQITAHKGRQVRYQWGRLGERTGLVYPDGRKVSYEYDEWSRLSRLIDGNREIQYHYREDGRLSEKVFSDGLITSYDYNEMGLITSLIHRQGEKELEQYRYTYDRMGNKTRIEKRRAECFRAEGVPEEISRKLSAESGIYQYRYDKLNRLTEVLHGNETVSRYVYDAFGNRIQSKHGYEERRYEYNAANQLLRSVSGGRVECYQYDKRGNLTEIIRDDRTIYRYRYDETNRLAEAVNGSGQAVRYEYNGLGNRTGRREYKLEGFAGGGSLTENPALPKDPVRETEYLLDLTKPYHNLLERREIIEDQTVSQVYTWDSNVVYTTEGESAYMYLQDELGSPVRLVGVQETRERGSSMPENPASKARQIIYGYDEFGNDLYGTQGEVQPFGYTGYQKDSITNTYFAQAREYMPNLGRFFAKDRIRGNSRYPKTMNRYTYCWGAPLNFIDLNGLFPSPLTNSDIVPSQDHRVMPSNASSNPRYEGRISWQTYGKNGQYDDMIRGNKENILNAASAYGLDPQTLAACIYVEQVKNVDFKDYYLDWTAGTLGLDTSLGIAQVKISTAQLVDDVGYMQFDEEDYPGFVDSGIMSRLADDEINIMYAAAYLKYQQDQWINVAPQITDPSLLGTLYNLGHEERGKGILGYVFGVGNSPRTAHASPQPNPFGLEVKNNYQKMGDLLGLSCEGAQ